MSTVSRTEVEGALKDYIDPYLKQDLVAANVIKDVRIADNAVEVDVELGFPAKGYGQQLNDELGQRIAKLGVGKQQSQSEL